MIHAISAPASTALALLLSMVLAASQPEGQWPPPYGTFLRSFPTAQVHDFNAARADPEHTCIVVLGAPRSVAELWGDDRVNARLSAFTTMRYTPGQSGSDQHRIPDLISRRPGAIAFRAGEVIDHPFHFNSVDETLAWLDQIEKGQPPSLEYIRAAAAADTRLPARLAFVDRLDRANLPHEADVQLALVYEAYLGFRGNTMSPSPDRGNPDLYDVHFAFLGTKGLLERAQDALLALPDGATRISAARDALAAIVEAGPESDFSAVSDQYRRWIDANGLVPDDGRLDEYLRALSDKPGREEAAHNARKLAVSLLLKREHWTAAVTMMQDPAVWIAGEALPLAMAKKLLSEPDADPETRAWGQGLIQRHSPTFLATVEAVYGATLAAGRDEDAARVAESAMNDLDTPATRAALVRGALRVNEPRDFHMTWAQAADQAAPDQPPITPQLENALRPR